MPLGNEPGGGSVSFGHSDCERVVAGALAQPVLAVTSLAYVGAGVAVLSWAVRVRAPLAGAAGVALVAVLCTPSAWRAAGVGSGGTDCAGRQGRRTRL